LKVGLFASKGCGSADVCILGNLVAWDNALLAWARFFFLFFSPLQRFGSRVARTDTVGFTEWKLLGYRSRISQDPNFCCCFEGFTGRSAASFPFGVL